MNAPYILDQGQLKHNNDDMDLMHWFNLGLCGRSLEDVTRDLYLHCQCMRSAGLTRTQARLFFQACKTHPMFRYHRVFSNGTATFSLRISTGC